MKFLDKIFGKTAKTSHNKWKHNIKCKVCGKTKNSSYKNVCNACYMYKMRNGRYK